MRELKHRLFLRLTTWLTLTACFAVLFSALLANRNLSTIMTLWGDDLQVTAYLEAEAAPERILDVEKKLKNDRRIGRYQWISREKALGDFRTQMASYAPDLAGDDDLLSLIPSSFQISLGRETRPELLSSLAEDLRKIPGIEDVRYGQEWLKKYSAVLSAMRGFAGVGGVILLIASLLVIGNAVRASVDARRHEVEVFEMIGATPWMIRRPFLVEGALLGFLSSSAAVALSGLGFALLRGVMHRELGFLNLAPHLQSFSLVSACFTVVFGTLLGALASYLCIRRLNDGWAAAGGRR